VQIIFQNHPTEGCIPACVLSILAHRGRGHRYTEESLIEAITGGGQGTDFVRLSNGAPALHLSVGAIPSTQGGVENFLQSTETLGTMVCLRFLQNHCVVIVSFQPNGNEPAKGIVTYVDPDPKLHGAPQETSLADFMERNTGEWARLP
jgi:hypothetical protein